MNRYRIALVAAALTIGFSAGAQDRLDRITVPLTDPSRPVTLDIDLYAGTVNISAFDGKDVVVEASGAAGAMGPAGRRPALDENRTNVVKRPASRQGRGTPSRGQAAGDSAGLTPMPQPTALDIEEANNVVSLRGPSGRRIDLTVQVPMRTSLRLKKAAMGPPSSPGTVTVRGLDGDLEIHTEAGAITLSDVAGSVVAHSTTGSVVAALRRVTPDRPMAFTSYSGSVDVTLPPSLKANLILQSDRGDVFTNFELQIGKAASAPVAQPGGGFRRAGRQPLRAVVNGGGPDVELRTYAGHVYLRKAN